MTDVETLYGCPYYMQCDVAQAMEGVRRHSSVFKKTRRNGLHLLSYECINLPIFLKTFKTKYRRFINTILMSEKLLGNLTVFLL